MTIPPPTPKRGMPKWLIILLIVALIAILGCGSCVVSCIWGIRKGAEVGSKKLDEFGKQVQQEMEKQQKARLEELRKRGIDPSTLPGGAPTVPGQSATLPANFPSDLLLPKDASITFSTNDGHDAGSVMFTCPGDVASNSDFYLRELARLGWQRKTDIGDASIRTLSFTKSDQIATVQIQPVDEAKNSLISILYGKQ